MQIDDEVDLSHITEFDPALIYGFDPQDSESMTYFNSPDNLINWGNYVAQQYEDVYYAYLYAQKEILPALRKMNIDQLTTEMVMKWLDEIHLRMSATLALDKKEAGFTEKLAGVNTPLQVLVNKFDLNIVPSIKEYLAKSMTYNELMDLCPENHIKESVTNFVKLLEEISKMEVELGPDEQAQFAKHNKSAGDLIFYKLISLHHANKLTKLQLDIVSAVLQIKAPPSQMQNVKLKFAQDLVANLKTCLKSDQDSKVRFCYFIFYGITSGHWYFDGNGRTATCFLNIFLRFFNLPSILIRMPKEKDNLGSAYSLAIKNIESNPAKMIKHIKSRLNDALKGKNYKNENEAVIFRNRIKSKNLFLRLKQLFPQLNLNPEFEKEVLSQSYSLQMLYQDTNDGKLDRMASEKIYQWCQNTLQLHISTMEQNLKNKYGIQTLDASGKENAFRKAAAQSNLEDMHYLVNCGVNINSPQPFTGRTALHYAVDLNKPRSVAFLLQASAKKDSKDSKDNEPKDFIRENTDEEIKQLFGLSFDSRLVPQP